MLEPENKGTQSEENLNLFSIQFEQLYCKCDWYLQAKLAHPNRELKNANTGNHIKQKQIRLLTKSMFIFI